MAVKVYLQENKADTLIFQGLLKEAAIISKTNISTLSDVFINYANSNLSSSHLAEVCQLVNKAAINTQENPIEKLRAVLTVYLNCASMPDIPSNNKTLFIQSAAKLFHQAYADLRPAEYSKIFTTDNVNPDVAKVLVEEIYQLSKQTTDTSSVNAIISNPTKSAHVIKHIKQATSNTTEANSIWASTTNISERALNNIELIDKNTREAAAKKLKIEIDKLIDFSEIDAALKALQDTFSQQMPTPGDEIAQAMKLTTVIQQRKVNIEANINEHLSDNKVTLNNNLSVSESDRLKQLLLQQKNELLSSNPEQARKAIEDFRNQCQQLFAQKTTLLNKLLQIKSISAETIEEKYIKFSEIITNFNEKFDAKINTAKT
ncbi:MAG: hypothetical protein ACK4PR_04400, partial [Gammaproteobacteria bacterium]